MNYLIIALGSAIGAMARHFMLSNIAMKSGFPLGLLIINVSGSMLLGIIVKLCSSGAIYLFLVTGILGGFTSFASFIMDIHKLSDISSIMMLLYLALSIMLSFILFALGFYVTEFYHR